MLYLGRGGRVRTGALAGLVGIDAAFHTPLDRQAEHRAEPGMQAEGTADDQLEHRRQALVVEHHDHQRNEEVGRAEEHTSELQPLMRNSYATFCLKNKITTR